MSAASPLVLVARIVAQPGRESAVEGALRALLAPTRAEPGCEAYDLHRDLEDRLAFVMLERWTSEAAWRDHMATAHVAAFRAATEADLDEFSVRRLAAI